jgi:hypothetical protein
MQTVLFSRVETVTDFLGVLDEVKMGTHHPVSATKSLFGSSQKSVEQA